MKNDSNVLMVNNIKNDLRYAGVGDISSDRTNILWSDFFKRVAEIQSETPNEIESDDLEGQGIEKLIIPYNISDIYIRLEILLALKISGRTNTTTEASNLIDELNKRGEIQNEQQSKSSWEVSYNKIGPT